MLFSPHIHTHSLSLSLFSLSLSSVSLTCPAAHSHTHRVMTGRTYSLSAASRQDKEVWCQAVKLIMKQSIEGQMESAGMLQFTGTVGGKECEGAFLKRYLRLLDGGLATLDVRAVITVDRPYRDLVDVSAYKDQAVVLDFGACESGPLRFYTAVSTPCCCCCYYYYYVGVVCVCVCVCVCIDMCVWVVNVGRPTDSLLCLLARLCVCVCPSLSLSLWHLPLPPAAVPSCLVFAGPRVSGHDRADHAQAIRQAGAAANRGEEPPADRQHVVVVLVPAGRPHLFVFVGRAWTTRPTTLYFQRMCGPVKWRSCDLAIV